jgi:hypothetical protein
MKEAYCVLRVYWEGNWVSMDFEAMPGPEARALRVKTMRHRSFLGPGGQAVLSPRTGISDVGAPAPFCGSQAGSPGRILSPPMLFPGNALTSGPQAWFGAEKGFLKVKVGKILSLSSFPFLNVSDYNEL